ncbi:MAG: bifunctional tetrahydrofolate synthase/dihydrofolate synthase [Rhodoferax sp.]|nr:bifunctional tetrahydrofolate synthase/dihydrofolate synthase [Rhodoferax sp.]
MPHSAKMNPSMNQDLAPLPTTLQGWLAHCERLHPKTIDMGLERVRRVAHRMGLKLDCPVYTVAGTNGKGSTCAMLESILRHSGYRTALYSSPHLVHFEERLRLDGEPVNASELIASFAAVERARARNDDEISLTYFEFSTLAILDVIARCKPDVAILEVGMGGRLDAVNIVDADCAIITSIDLDHMEFLGPDREAIGFEKAGVMRTGRPVIVSDPVPPQSVIERAREIDADLWRSGIDFHFSGDAQQWGWACSAARGGRRYSGMAYPALRGANQLINAAGVLAALTALRERLPISAQAIRVGLAQVALTGRFQILPGQPALVLDVSHNPHSVAAMAVNLDAMGFFPVTHAVFGAMADKDLAPMLERVMPLMDRWYFTDLPTPRADSAAGLQRRWQALNRRSDVQSSVHPDPASALEAALAAADPADRIVVFGSFYTVGGVLQHGLPRTKARHGTG